MPPAGPGLRAVPCIIMPALSSSVIRLTRSFARAEGGRRQSSYGSRAPFLFGSLNRRPCCSMMLDERETASGCVNRLALTPWALAGDGVREAVDEARAA